MPNLFVVPARPGAQKWSKGKVKEKANNLVLFDQVGPRVPELGVVHARRAVAGVPGGRGWPLQCGAKAGCLCLPHGAAHVRQAAG